MKTTNILLLSLLIICVSFYACWPFGDDGNSEPQVALPTLIQNFIASNYPDYKIEKAEKEIDCTGAEVYEVELEATDDDEIELTFDLEGSLLFTETKIKNEELPETVMTTLNTEYTDYKLEDAERLDLTTDGVIYEVELKKDKTELDVRLSAAGTVICEQEDND